MSGVRLARVVAALGLGLLVGGSAQASTVAFGLTMAQGRSAISGYEDKGASQLEAKDYGGTVDWTITGCWRISTTRVNCKVRLVTTLPDGTPGIRCTPTDTAWLVRTTIYARSVTRPCVVIRSDRFSA